MPARARRVVVLPAPLGPTRPSTSPRLTASERPLTATKVPYVLVSWLTSTARSIGSSYGPSGCQVAVITRVRAAGGWERRVRTRRHGMLFESLLSTCVALATRAPHPAL